MTIHDNAGPPFSSSRRKPGSICFCPACRERKAKMDPGFRRDDEREGDDAHERGTLS